MFKTAIWNLYAMFKWNYLPKVYVVYSKRFCSSNNKLTKIVCAYTGLTETRADLFLKKYKLNKRSPDFMIDSFETYLTKMGFTIQEIIENGKLFNCYPREHEQHLWVMEEGGFNSFKPQLFLRSRSLLKWKISKLKRQGFISNNLNVADNFLKYINNSDFLKKIELKYSDDMTWTSVHFAIACQYLAWRLQASGMDIRELFVIHPGMPNKSFRIMEKNISLAEELGFTSQRILKCGYLIKNYPEYTKQTLREFPMLAGCNMKTAMRANPNLIVTPTTRIRKTYEILKEFNIPDESIRTEMGIFQVAPETIKSRLEEIKNSPDTEPLLKIPRLLTLLLHHTRAKSRLPFLQHMNLKCTNYYILGACHNDAIEQFIREDKDINYKKDVYHYLKRLLDTDNEKGLIEKISRHPYYLNVPLKDIAETYKYLIRSGFRRPNIHEALWILLYPVEKVRNSLHKLKIDEAVPFLSLNQIQKLNMMLYTIEKEHHFTGHGIFNSSNSDFQD